MEPSSLPEVEDRVDESARSQLVSRHFTRAGEDPFETIEWGRRDAQAGDFWQSDVEAPVDWSDDSIGVVAKLYFATVGGVQEDSVRQMIYRVARRITEQGIVQGHFEWPDVIVSQIESRDLPIEPSLLPVDDPARIFFDELVYICLHQIAGFNTPTWLNCGVDGRRETCHACYPLSIKDTMLGEGGITDWWRTEATIFKTGGGAGINLSNLRGSMEKLSTGGIASGPISYMRAANAAAETLKSGGAHRRAAKFICLDVDHPDVLDFVDVKVREDRRMRLLMEAGEDLSIFTPEGERNVAEVTSFQSGNNSVCVTDDFMRAVEDDGDWSLTARVSGDVVSTHKARDIMKKIAEAAWECADPGVIFIDTINRFHTTPSLGPITTVNTCGEICQNDNTACNLAALNVMKFLSDGDQSFDVAGFQRVVEVMLTAQDIIDGFSELPTPEIERNTRDLRQCGLGFTNLGAAIMAQGMPYDSSEARSFAAAITALLTGCAWSHSATMAEKLGAFERFDENRDVMMRVVERQAVAVVARDRSLPSDETYWIWKVARRQWLRAQALAADVGFRNSQVTTMMPCGTVSFLLGADTSGIEPVFSLVTHKKLAAAGSMEIINQSARMCASALGGYSDENLLDMAIGDFSCIASEDLPSFATAIGENSIDPMGHLKMVAEMQPFVTQSLSKTINVPNETTSVEIFKLYMEAWRRGVKVISVYRDGSKATQVLSAVKQEKDEPVGVEAWSSVDEAVTERQSEDAADEALEKIEGDLRRADLVAPVMIGQEPAGGYATGGIVPPIPTRRRLPRTRRGGVTHKIHVRSSLGEHEGYISAGLYDDGTLGEVFMEGFGRMGGFVQNVLSAWSTAFSIGLQYGVPFDVLVRKHVGHSDETGGMVVPDPSGEPLAVRSCDSIVDYIARWLVSEFGDVDLQEELGVMTAAVKARKSSLLDDLSASIVEHEEEISEAVSSAPTFADVFQVREREYVDRARSNGNGHHKETTISAQACPECYKPMRRAGACLQCSCGYSSGGCG